MDGQTRYLHCSQISRWALCEKAAVWRFEDDAPEPATVHVATWIGEAVHARVSGMQDPPPPKAVRFDKTTPTWRTAKWQVAVMATALQRRLDEDGREVVAQEWQCEPYRPCRNWPDDLMLSGRCDLVTRDFKGKLYICDIKTAKSIRPAWIQLGAYALLWARNPPEIAMRPADMVSTFHCPRPTTNAPPKVGVYEQDAEECTVEAVRILWRIGEIIRVPDDATASPGNRCSFCEHPTCVVRNHDIAS